MEKIQFKCHLLSDVILPDTSATEGNRNSLDFIPGNNFLGIAARHLYDVEDEHTWLLFHSGHVRFGDAHSAVGHTRSIKIPADIFFPKYNNTAGEAYVYHCVDDFDAVRNKQLKQARTGFYATRGDMATAVGLLKQFAIKSAYDTKRRRSEDERLFGYEAMVKGRNFLFTVELDNVASHLREEIINALTGNQHLGRSRTAQYGWVNIQECPFDECPSIPTKAEEGTVIVYADGRLIFFDDDGMPTFQPTARQLGFEQGTVDWSRSQVRTFQYAPWNYKRHAFDTDRCGIEKGSVIVVNTTAPLPSTDYVGFYCNEGFGKVIYNPAILQTMADSNGRSAIRFENEATRPATKSAPDQKRTLLLDYLNTQKEKDIEGQAIYNDVDDWVKCNGNLFQGDRFASQWGTIRGIAMATDDKEKIIGNIKEYLGHGVAKSKWDERGRNKKLMDFLTRDQRHVRERVINLASEMGKKCKKNND